MPRRPTLADYDNETLGRMIREAASNREAEFIESTTSRNSLVKFLKEVGLDAIAKAISEAAEYVWEKIKEFFINVFM
jgi:hypothetical protein